MFFLFEASLDCSVGYSGLFADGGCFQCFCEQFCESLEGGLFVCCLGSVFLRYDAEDAFFGDSFAEAFGDAVFLRFGQVGRACDVEQERNAGVEFVYVLSAGPAAAGVLEDERLFCDLDSFCDFHRAILTFVRDV